MQSFGQVSDMGGKFTSAGMGMVDGMMGENSLGLSAMGGQAAEGMSKATKSFTDFNKMKDRMLIEAAGGMGENLAGNLEQQLGADLGLKNKISGGKQQMIQATDEIFDGAGGAVSNSFRSFMGGQSKSKQN